MTTNTADLLYAAGAVAAMGVAVYMLSSPTKKDTTGFQVCTASGSCSDPTFKASDFSGDVTDPNWSPTVTDMGKITVDMAEGFRQNAENTWDSLMGVINNENPDGSYGCMRASDVNDPRCKEPAETAGSKTAVAAPVFAKFNDYITKLQNPDIQQLADGCFTNVIIDMGDSVQSMYACPNTLLCSGYKNASGECAVYGGTSQAGKTVTVLKGTGWDSATDAENNVYQNLGVSNYANALSEIDYQQFGAVVDYANVGVTKPIVPPPPGPWTGPPWGGNPATCTSSKTITKDQWDAMTPLERNALALEYSNGKLNFKGLCLYWSDSPSVTQPPIGPPPAPVAPVAWKGPSWFGSNPPSCDSSYTYTSDQWNKVSTIQKGLLQTRYAATKTSTGPCFTWQ
jgi:hypothetical protein